ncbi:hypothetical protein [Caldivirga sp. UBA161]|uniref:hypothetical protein n=1 Tax=Caldivirga sp. UBA161 TaxID=1915569 RepID=UPI0025C5B57C|nr:hypothetical protein [Caldivirga sp. UBA161]
MDKNRRLALILIADLALAGAGYLIVRNLPTLIRGSSELLRTPTTSVKLEVTKVEESSMILKGNLNGPSFSIYPNQGLVLNNDMIAFQLIPGSSGDYAVLVVDGNVYLIVPSIYPPIGPNLSDIIKPNVDLSNITGASNVGDYMVFGGGMECYGRGSIPSPWSPCAYPCAAYQAFYNRLTGGLNVLAIPGGSCDNNNMTFAVEGNESDILTFGGGNYPSYGTTGATHRTAVNSIKVKGLEPAMYTTIDVVDSVGNMLNKYRLPGLRDGSDIYMLFQVANSNTLLLEYVNISELYGSMQNNPSVLCTGKPTVQPTPVTTLANDFNGDAIPAMWLSNGELYVTYHSIDDSIKVVSNEGHVVTLGKVPVTPFIKYVNSTLYVGYNMMANGKPIFVINAYDPYTGDQYGSVSLNGLGFVDINGKVSVFTGLTQGSNVKIYKLEVA